MAAKLGSYKGHTTITLEDGSKYPFSFGLAKARLILAHLEEIKAFVGSSALPAPKGGDRFDMGVEDRMAEQCGLNGGGR